MKYDSLLERAHNCDFCRGALRDLAGHLPEDDDALDRVVAEAIGEGDELAFTHVLLSALDAGRRVDARHLAAGAPLVPDPGILAAAAMRCSGEVAEALVEAVRRGHMGWEREAAALLAVACWCQENRDGRVPGGLAAQARKLARQTVGDYMTQISLLALSQIVEDDGLKSALKTFDLDSPEIRDIATGFRNALIIGPDESVFDFVPERPTPSITSGFTVRRSVARVGRNAPCPCGSGKKYKKCCYDKDQERLRHSSDVAGVTVDELRASPEVHLDAERLMAMRSYELSRLDPAKVAAELHPLLLNQLILFGQFEPVLAFFKQVGVREELDGHLVDAVNFAADASEAAIVRELLELRGDRQDERYGPSLAAQLLASAEAPGPVLEKIEARARKVLEAQTTLDAVDLSHSMLSSFPALGILIARGAIPLASPFDAPVLLDRLLETRDRLELPPKDPIEAVYDDRFLDHGWPGEEETEALVATRDALEQKSAEVRNLRHEVLELRQSLQRREKRASAEAVTPPPVDRSPEPQADASVPELRQRLASLKSDLTQRHLERNQLRRELVNTREDLNELRAAQTAVPDPPPAAGDEPEDALLASEETFGSQPMRVPTFPNKFAEELEKLPRGVPRAVLRLIGDLAAGEPAAFKGARRLARNREVWRQRVASSFRLLFRLQPRSLEVLALVNRQGLERTIKSLG